MSVCFTQPACKHYCWKMSTLAVVDQVDSESGSIVAVETRYRISVSYFRSRSPQPCRCGVGQGSGARDLDLAQSTLIADVRGDGEVARPGNRNAHYVLTLRSTGASEPPAYVPDKEAAINRRLRDCGVMNPKETAGSVPIMNAWLLLTR